MKKLFTTLLAVVVLISMATVASAAETTITKTTTLTTNVPAASYVLNIPANQEISYGEMITEIGAISITEGAGFAKYKNVVVTVSYGEFVSEAVDTTIPFVIKIGTTLTDSYEDKEIPSGTSLVFEGKADGTIAQYCTNTNKSNWGELTKIVIQSGDWGKALAGEYTATITFSAEVAAA